MWFGDLTYEEVAEAAANGALAVLPTGCTEQQGPHLPVDNDTWFAGELVAEAAARFDNDQPVLVLPALPFGPTPEHRNFGAGYIDIPTAVYDDFVSAVLHSLADQGFGRILVWRGCGGHDLRTVVTMFNEARKGSSRAFLPGHPFHDIWCSVAHPTVPGGHADSFTTSILMAKRPEAVRADRIPQDISAQPDWADPDLDFSPYSTTGVVGTARYASKELGERLWDACVDAVAETIRQVMEDPSVVGVERTNLFADAPSAED